MEETRPNFAETPYGIVKRLQVVQEWLPRNAAPLRILDYGCGTGEHLTFPLAEAGHSVLGVDVHAASIDQARSQYRLRNIEFRTASGNALKEEESSFDAIICSEVLEHLEMPALLLNYLHTMLKPGGRLIVTTPNGRGSYEILCTVERRLHKLGIHQVFRSLAKPQVIRESPGFLNFDSTHVQFFSLKELDRLFADAGFKVLDRRARTLVCGPYADLLFQWLPFRSGWIRLNARLADHLPLRCAADWMFLLSKA